MSLIKIREDLYVPEDFVADHNYYADPEGKQRYSGITTVLGVLAKPALIPWAARMVVECIKANAEKQEMVRVAAFKGEDVGPSTLTYLVTDELLEEAKSAHTRKKEEAGAHGTDAHALVETYVNFCLNLNEGKPLGDLMLNGDSIEGPDGIFSVPDAIRPFVVWALENVDHFLFSERRMANKELFCAGTADFAYVGKDGRRYMSDFKTSSSIWDEYWYQVAAYRYMAEAEGDDPYDGLSIVRMGKDGKFEVKHLYDYDTVRDGFLAALTLYRKNALIKGVVVH